MAEYTRRYNPDRSADWNYGGKKWRLSRSKIDFFIECPRCFYVDNKLGTKRPGMPSFNLNIAVDELFKKEFDVHRAAGTKHPIMNEYKVDALPFVHKNMDAWRENFEGIECKHEETGMPISGAVDDIWVTPEEKLIVVDYKATSKDGTIKTLSDSPWEAQYKRQIGVYQWLLEQNGFTVDNTGYFVYANASKAEDRFSNTLVFETTLVPCTGDTSWIDGILVQIKECLETDAIPSSGANCEFCPYREAAGKKLLKMHNALKAKPSVPATSNDGGVAATIAHIKNKHK
jgi:CRISPR/Cas system-associated exonuclease Cas4 (RecB family)